jgi:hypothetical protein
MKLLNKNHFITMFCWYRHAVIEHCGRQGQPECYESRKWNEREVNVFHIHMCVTHTVWPAAK